MKDKTKKYAVKVFTGFNGGDNDWLYQVNLSLDPVVVLYKTLEEASAAAQCFRRAIAVEYEEEEMV